MTTDPANYVFEPGEVDLDTEVVLDGKGRRIDQTYVEEAVEQVHAHLRRIGRPSLTGDAAVSPQVTFRITPELKAQAERAAKESGKTVSELAREAFQQYLAS